MTKRNANADAKHATMNACDLAVSFQVISACRVSKCGAKCRASACVQYATCTSHSYVSARGFTPSARLAAETPAATLAESRDSRPRASSAAKTPASTDASSDGASGPSAAAVSDPASRDPGGALPMSNEPASEDLSAPTSVQRRVRRDPAARAASHSAPEKSAAAGWYKHRKSRTCRRPALTGDVQVTARLSQSISRWNGSIAAAIDPFHLEIDWLRRAVTWTSPVKAGLLHVLLFLCLYHPAAALFSGALWLAARAAGSRRTRRWTLVGADKSSDAGSFDIGRAPPGSRLAGSETAAALGPDAPSELASVDAGVFAALDARGRESRDSASVAAGVSAASRALGVNPRAETYEWLVQVAYWTQALARHFAPHFETLHALMTWKDTAKSHAFMVACFASAFAFLFVKWRVFALALCFVALRHPVAGKPATAPYRLALAADP